MEFTIIFYATEDGRKPMLEFLEELRAEDLGAPQDVLRALEKLKSREYHREPLTKPLGAGLFEVRILGKLNSRVLYCFASDRPIVLLHGIRHKAQRIPRNDLEVAVSRMKDWIRRQAK